MQTKKIAFILASMFAVGAAHAQLGAIAISSPLVSGNGPATASASSAIAIGDYSTAGLLQYGGSNALLISPYWSYTAQTAVGSTSLAWGQGDTALGAGAVAISQPALGTNGAATSVGYGATSWGNNSVAIGAKATAGGGAAGTAPTSNPTISNATAIGATANAAANNSTALGFGATAMGTNSVALGAGSYAMRANSVDIGSRQITGVAAGTQATDAVNLGQLQAAIAGVGGGSPVDTGAIVREANAYTDHAINAIRREYSQAIAAVGANPVLPSMSAGEQAIAVAASTYNGYQAIGILYGRAVNNSSLINAGISSAGAGRPVARIGAAWKW